MRRLIELIGSLIDRFMRRFYPPPPIPPPEPVKPPTELPKPPPEPPAPLDFSTPQKAFKSVRILCDEARLTYEEKNLICAVIYQESRFSNKAKNQNIRPDGTRGSIDWGIAQINDYWHIGPNKTFPSVEYVLDHPDKVVQWMIRQYKAGNLIWWVAYSSGAHKQWLKPNSPMWTLR